MKRGIDTQKTSWVIEFKKPTTFISQPYKCAICGEHLNNLCIDCFKNNQIIDQQKADLINKLYLMLLMRKQKSCIFSHIPRDAFNTICKMVLATPDVMNEPCRIVKLECNHLFHRHCFVLWTRKRRGCPLDENTSIIPIEVHNPKRQKVSAKLCIVTDDVMQYYAEKIQQQNLQALRKSVIARIHMLLKHHKPGYNKDALYNLLCVKFNKSIDKYLFEAGIDYLMDREYILQTGPYHYIYNKHY